LLPDEVAALGRSCGLPLVEGRVATTADEAVAAAEALGLPVVAKLVSRTLVHKTDLGGVQLNLRDAAAVRQAFASIRGALEAAGQEDAFEGVLVQPMLSGGVEIMAGMTEDPVFGPLIAFGLGGVHVEVLGDVVFRVAPLTDKDAHAMVQGIRGRKLLEGYRGHPPADEPALENMLLRLSRLVAEGGRRDRRPRHQSGFRHAPGRGLPDRGSTRARAPRLTGGALPRGDQRACCRSASSVFDDSFDASGRAKIVCASLRAAPGFSFASAVTARSRLADVPLRR